MLLLGKENVSISIKFRVFFYFIYLFLFFWPLVLSPLNVCDVRPHRFVKVFTLPARLSKDHPVWIKFGAREVSSPLLRVSPWRRRHTARGYEGCLEWNRGVCPAGAQGRRKERELKTTFSSCSIHLNPSACLTLLFTASYHTTATAQELPNRPPRLAAEAIW